MVLQFQLRALLPDFAKLIDDLTDKNYHTPELMNGHCVLRQDDGLQLSAAGGILQHQECDDVDAEEQPDYSAEHLVLKQTVGRADGLRLDAIIELMRQMLRGQNATRSQLRRVLTREQFSSYEESLTEVTEFSESAYGSGMPESLKSYNEKLRLADLAWGKYQSKTKSKRRNYRSRRNWEDVAESRYESAIERLQEIFECARRGDYGAEALGQLELWMDRPVSFDPIDPNCVGIDCESVPRVRGSTSYYSKCAGLPKLSKRLKSRIYAAKALLVAGTEIAFEMPIDSVGVLTTQQRDQLRDKLSRLQRYSLADL